MKLEDVKVGQKVFITRESTAKVDSIDAFALNFTKLLNKVFGVDVVEECKEKGGFYVVEVKDNGNVCLGDIKEDGTFSYGWGLYDASDIEPVNTKPQTRELDNLLDVLIRLDNKLDEIKSFYSAPKTEEKRKRGRPRKTK